MKNKSIDGPLLPQGGGTFNRRTMMKGSGALVGSTLLGTTLANLEQRQAHADELEPIAGPFGAPGEAVDQTTGLPLLKLPRGFQYASFSWTGDIMNDSQATPGSHDGMAVVATSGREYTLIRNHENGLGDLISGSGVYDGVKVPGELVGSSGTQSPAGGTTRLKFNGRNWISAEGSLGGTLVNCAGGPTPWNSWLTCEETTTNLQEVGGRQHGFIFDVPASGMSSGVALTDMGLFAHEAVAIDPRNNIAYLTEDRGNNSGFYRFVPNDASGGLDSYQSGGQLQMLRVAGTPEADLDNPARGESFTVEWVDIADPTALPEDTSDPINYGGRSGPYMQGREQGAARFKRLEGAWYSDGVIYFTDTSSGPANEGVVWVYRPDPENPAGGGELTALFVAQSTLVGNNPDNVTVSPDGLILFCEDGGGQPLRMMGVTPEGESFVFGVNNVVLDDSDIARIGRTGQFSAGDHTEREWAGVCFSPDGNVLFVNIQTPGVTFAIWGPFGRARRMLGRDRG